MRINTEIDEESRQILNNSQKKKSSQSVKSNLKRPVSNSNKVEKHVGKKWGGKYSVQNI